MPLEVQVLLVLSTLSSSKYYKHYSMGYELCESAQAPAVIPDTMTPAAGQQEPHTSVRKQLWKATARVAGSALSLGKPPTLLSIFSAEAQKKVEQHLDRPITSHSTTFSSMIIKKTINCVFSVSNRHFLLPLPF